MKYLFFSILLILSISSIGQVGIGTQTPNSKAALDVTSTSQGLLPPRMSTIQRDLIVSSPAGLVIYNTTSNSLEYYNGTLWVSLTPSTIYTIGLHPELGGYVFDITADGKHGMVAEIQDQTVKIDWYSTQDSISNPAYHSSDGKNFRDWRIPTKYELNEMYTQQIMIGGFSNSNYWSSSENTYNFAWYKNFTDGFQNGYNKSAPFSVRAVRAF